MVGAQDLFQKSDLEQKHNCYNWMKNPMAEVHNENDPKKKKNDDFGLRNPVIQKTFSPKKRYTLIPLS